MIRTTPHSDPVRDHRHGAPERRGPLPTFGLINDELPVECWCHAEIVHVPVRAVRACQTRSCGLPGCTPTKVVK